MLYSHTYCFLDPTRETWLPLGCEDIILYNSKILIVFPFLIEYLIYLIDELSFTAREKLNAKYSVLIYISLYPPPKNHT